ncbi:mucin-2 protein [Nocardioides sp. NPDC051685]|uniref:mucin-2 protein n=1 Tax=Nocardioides sp. NPDC051685 TaxID=3364334 RepID=UPI0037961D5D
MATAGIVTFATSGAMAAGAAAANPGTVISQVEERSGLRLPTPAERRIEAEAQAVAKIPALPTTREDIRMSNDRREITGRETTVSRGGDREAGATTDALSQVPTIESLIERPTSVSGGAQKAVLRYVQEDVTVYASYGKRAKELGVLKLGRAVYYTGRDEGGRQEIVLEGTPVWIPEGNLGRSEPEPPPEPTPTPTPTPSPSPSEDAPAGLDFSACGDASVEVGLVPDAVDLYRAVCNAFPAVASGTTYGYDPHGEHADGKALDFMTDDKELGDAIAAFVQEHAAELNIYDIIWYQRIWTPVRADEGWRLMEDRGDPTANHYDHVHVAVN